MPTKTTEPPGPPRSDLIALLFVAVICRYLYVEWTANHGLSIHGFGLPAERIYADALNDWRSGADPYRTIHGALRFVYPPVFLYVGVFLGRLFPDHLGWYLYALLHLASTIALPIVLARYYFRERWLNTGFALLVFFAEPRLTGVMALANGNIASLLYLLALLAALPGFEKNRWGMFYAVLFVGGLIKLPFLLLLLFPLLTGTRQWRSCSLCVAAVVAGYLVQKICVPALYAGYKWSVEQQLTVIHHYGYGVLGIAAGLQYKLYGRVGIISSLIAAVFTLFVVGALFLLRRRIAEPAGNRLWISLILLATIVASPRILPYDADVALMAAFVILVNVTQTRRLLVLLILLFLPSLLVPHFIKSPTLAGCYETLVLLVAFASGFAVLWRKPVALKLDTPQPV
ncbi:MAG TPA: glycosyltransferase 87 family protein [Silvibacterium sp.]|nr:glycosyltransferase 87 family protein [Silvibacterium sp.]